MWTKPYSMREGFLIGGGLVVAGLLLQLSAGPVVWSVFSWPVNGVMLAVFLGIVAVIFGLQKRVYGLRFIGTYKAAIPALVYGVGLTIVMGLTRQTVDGDWLNNMLAFWPFVLIYVYLTAILGVVTLRRFGRLRGLRDITFLLSHLGIFLAMTTATLGSADMQRLKMIVAKGEPEWRAMDRQGMIKEMPLAIELRQFIMETYADGKPKRYASEVQILTQSGKNIHTTIDVNKPAEVDGWKIYQYGYDTKMGPMSQTSILELISDPWLPWVYAGFYMMMAGAVCFMLQSIPWRSGWQRARKHPKRAVSIAVLIAAAFFCVHHFMPILHSDTLVPALQSPWFRPHIVVYMLAYTLMGAAAVIALVMIVMGKDVSSASLATLDHLVYVGISLITIGMLFGALWAKEAWGHYWEWDPKETWAAITWLAYLGYVHYRQIPTHKPRLALWVLLISFVLLQMCWWGINYLPSAQGASVHVYSQS